VPVVVGMVPRMREIRLAGKGATGVSLEYPYDVQFRHLRLLLPDARLVGVIYSTDENEKEIPHATDAAAREGFELLALRVDGPQGLPGALEVFSRRVDAVWSIPDRLLLNVSTAKGLILFSFRNRIPLVGLSPSWVRAGALYSMSWDYRDIGRQCGDVALETMGTGRSVSPPSPASPRRVLYSVNRKTASQMKLRIEESLLSGAQEVY
jgi:putative ABC transport system substrate-binding protein